MPKLRKWLIHKLGGYVKGETQCVVRKDGIYFKTAEDTQTMAMSTLNADEIIVGAKELQKQFEEYKANQGGI